MKRHIGLLFIIIAGFISCGDDDDKPVIDPPVVNKLTKVTCAKNGIPAFTFRVTYNQDGQITNIVRDGTYTDIFSYTADKISVNSFSSEGGASPVFKKRIEYKTSGGGIIFSDHYQLNPYMTNVEYLSDTYNYMYNRNVLVRSQWIEAYWPKEDGSGYDSREMLETNDYTWENGNITRYKNGTKEMAFRYKNEQHPESFPFRIINTFNPTGHETVNPLNFLFGNGNQNLIETAEWYILPDVNNVCAKYIFSYNTTGDYVTSMTINEELFPAAGGQAENNIYTYTFEYEYK